VRLMINGEEVSYSLENERTLGQVVKGIQEWLAAAGFLITEMRAARQPGVDMQDLLQAPAADWGRTPVGSVRELEVRATHTGELKLEHWRTVDAWLGMLADEIRAIGKDDNPGSGAGSLESLLADLPETMEGLKTNPFLPPASRALDELNALFSGQAATGKSPQPAEKRAAAAEVGSWPADRLQAAAAQIDGLRADLQKRIADASRPAEALARCAAGVRDSLARLPEVSLLLQTGRDKDAMDIVIGFTDTVQSLLMLVPFLSPDPERGKVLAEFTPVLRELVAAFDSKDSVLIGDLLEYEITPRMQRLAPHLEKAP
jgi:hypothetical protein